jgi:nitroreductase
VRNWDNIFGVPNRAALGPSLIDHNDFERILSVASGSDTDLLYQPCQVVAVTDPDLIQRIGSSALHSERIATSSLIVLIGAVKGSSLQGLMQVLESVAAHSASIQEFGRYKSLLSDQTAADKWETASAALCAGRLVLAGKALGYSATALQVFEAATLGSIVEAPGGVDFHFVVAFGGALTQRVGDSENSRQSHHAYSNYWGREIDLSGMLESPKVVYKDSLVTYFDILGFRNVIEGWPAKDIEEILSKMLTHSTHDARLMRVTRRSLATFSDHVVRTVALDGLDETEIGNAVEFELSQVQLAQANLAAHGVFLRGGITRGPIYIDDSFVFGAALVEAYELESKVAKYPRVLIAESLQPVVLAHPHLWMRSDDGLWSVNYLTAGDDLTERLRFAERHAVILRAALLQGHRPDVLEKYRWLAGMHNRVVDQIPSEDFEASGIAREAILVDLHLK